MKTDARIRYTKMAIKNSFVQMLQEMPIGKITVKGICELAEINRATFYKYYADPYDLMEQIKAEHFLDLQRLIEKTDNKHLLNTLTVVTNTIKNGFITF